MTTNQPAAAAISTRFGVYGAFLERGRLLAVRRAEGVDAGLLDLPGGAPEPHEQFSETLARVIALETGGRVVATGPWESFDVHATAESGGPRAARRETGVWCGVLLADVAVHSGARDGVLSVEWMPVFGWEDRTDLTAGLRAVLDAVCL